MTTPPKTTCPSSSTTRYANLRQCKTASSKYGIIQVGVCIFKKTEAGLKGFPYNFYTFPRPFGNKFNRDISLNNDCMTFHETVNTDINRWVYKGVNYFQYYMIETLEKMFFDPYDDKKDMTDTLNSKDKEAYEEFKKDYEKFVGSDKQVSED